MGFFSNLFGGEEAIPATSQTNPFQTSGGLFNQGFDDQGNINLGFTPEQQALAQSGFGGAQQFGGLVQNNAGSQQAQQLGTQFLSGLQADPFAAQQQLFAQQNQILAPLQEDARLAQESRLFSQGRLGSSGNLSGAGQQEALLRAQSAQTQGLFNQSFGQAQQQQLQQAGIGSNFLQLNPQLAGLFGQIQNQQLGVPLALQQGANQSLQTAGQLASSATGGTPGQTGLFEGAANSLIGRGVNLVANNIFS